MAITIQEAYIETFEANVRQLAQQTRSRLRDKVTEVNKQSEKHNWDRLAQSSARLKPGPRAVSPSGGDGSGAVGSTDGLAWTRRNTVIQTYDTGEVIEPENIVQMLIDPKSASTKNLVMNMQRTVDDIIIGKCFAPANDGNGGTVAFPTSQIVGDGTGIISLDTVLQVKELFETNDCDPDDTITMVISPRQKHVLMRLLEVTSADFQNAKALATGYMPNWMGMDWVVSNRLIAPSVGEIDCIAMTKSAMGLHVAGDIRSRVAERPDMSFAWQVYLMLNMDAVRVEDEKIVRVHLKDALS